MVLIQLCRVNSDDICSVSSMFFLLLASRRYLNFRMFSNRDPLIPAQHPAVFALFRTVFCHVTDDFH